MVWTGVGKVFTLRNDINLPDTQSTSQMILNCFKHSVIDLTLIQKKKKNKKITKTSYKILLKEKVEKINFWKMTK